MKIALLTDLHFGARADHPAFLENSRIFFKEVFFPIIDDYDIKTVIISGDTFDKRKYSNHVTVKAAKEILFDELHKRNITVYMLIGNHDIFYKNTLETNSISLLLPEYDNITIVQNPTIVTFDGSDIAMMSWICTDNQEESFEFIKNTRAEILIGHFEISGFEMHKNQECKTGLSAQMFNKFDMVFSGHYHHKSTKGNITYLGTSYEMTWHDYADNKGFHIFDTDTRTLEFAPNPNTLFVKIEYNDLNQEPIELDSLDLNKSYVKLIVVNKTNYLKFDQFVTTLQTKGCYDINIMENMREFESVEIDDSVNLGNTLDILEKYINTSDTSMDKVQITDFVKALYLEAITLEDV
jgi:DNA repair exonuclease SbcCD nuclease subunit